MMNAAAPAPRGPSGSLSVPVLPTNTSVSRHFRPGRHRVASPQDSFHLHAFGDNVHQKDAQSTRIYFQNVKGLTYSPSGEDFKILPGFTSVFTTN